MEIVTEAFKDLFTNNILFEKVIPSLFQFNFSIPNIPLLTPFVPYILLIFFALVAVSITYIIRQLLLLRKSLKEDSVLLQITPPVFTKKLKQ